MKVWAIRHCPTGRYMPARMSRRSARGWSHWSPMPPLDLGLDGPRIFFTFRSASNALSMWLQGVWKRETGTSYGWDGPDDWDQISVIDPPAPRKREEMEIVELELTETLPTLKGTV